MTAPCAALALRSLVFLASALPMSLIVGTAGPVCAATGPVDPAPAHRTEAASNDGLNRRVRIHNQTGWAIEGLFADSPPSARPDAQADDLLGGRGLASGDSGIVDIDDGSGACVYGLRARFTNGRSLNRAPVNACQIADYYFTR